MSPDREGSRSALVTPCRMTEVVTGLSGVLTLTP
jgi:hypothetical protein